MLKNKKENNSFGIKDFIIGLSGAVIGLIGALGSVLITTNNASNIKTYEYRKEAYSQFLSDYLNYFNNDTILGEYEKFFHKYMELEYLKDSDTYSRDKELIEKNEEVRNCLYSSPIECTKNMDNDDDRKYISGLIGIAQKFAFHDTMDQQLKNFRDKTFSIRLLLNGETYQNVMDKIAGKVYIAPSPFRDCDEYEDPRLEDWNPRCGIDFEQFMKEDEYTTVYGFSFIDDEVIDILSIDLEKYN